MKRSTILAVLVVLVSQTGCAYEAANAASHAAYYAANAASDLAWYVYYYL